MTVELVAMTTRSKVSGRSSRGYWHQISKCPIGRYEAFIEALGLFVKVRRMDLLGKLLLGFSNDIMPEGSDYQFDLVPRW